MTSEYGTGTRVDASGVLLLRSLCKLTHKGHKQYPKGDGHAFEDYLKKEWPGCCPWHGITPVIP